jgi:predicted acylesterase/phospholipase RssA
VIAWAIIAGLSAGAMVWAFFLAWHDDEGIRTLRAADQDLRDRLAVGDEWLP